MKTYEIVTVCDFCKKESEPQRVDDPRKHKLPEGWVEARVGRYVKVAVCPEDIERIKAQ